MIEIFEYLQHFQTQVEIFKEHKIQALAVLTIRGLLNAYIQSYLYFSTEQSPAILQRPNLYETYDPFTNFQDTMLNTDRGVNGYHQKC